MQCAAIAAVAASNSGAVKHVPAAAPCPLKRTIHGITEAAELEKSALAPLVSMIGEFTIAALP